MRVTESVSYLIPAIDLQPVTGTFFHVLFFLCGAIQGEALQCSSHLYFQMLPLTSQPNSFSSPPPPLPRATLLTPCTPRAPSLRGIWSFVFPIKGEIYSVHSYFLYLEPPLPRFTNERGGCGARRLRRLSRDHLAHLIKHRGFNLAPLVCRRAPSLKTTFTSSSMAGAADSRRGEGRKKKTHPAHADAPAKTFVGLAIAHQWHRVEGKISLRLAMPSFAIFYLIYLFICPRHFISSPVFVSTQPGFSPCRRRGATHGESPRLPR